jgi:hypothetical protein
MGQEFCRVIHSLSFAFYSELSTLFPPCRSNSPSTAAAPPSAAANTGNCCGKFAFLSLLPQLSSPPISDFSQKGLVKLPNLQNFSPIVTEGNACGMTSVKRWTQSFLHTGKSGIQSLFHIQLFQRIQRIEGKSVTINVG